jgi:hypothetical protein
MHVETELSPRQVKANLFAETFPDPNKARIAYQFILSSRQAGNWVACAYPGRAFAGSVLAKMVKDGTVLEHFETRLSEPCWLYELSPKTLRRICEVSQVHGDYKPMPRISFWQRLSSLLIAGPKFVESTQ